MRSTTVCVLLSLLAGCPDRSISAVDPEPGVVETKDIPTIARGADILFLVDNSGSMKEEQASLRANFGKMMQVLETLDGGMPNVHIGVATSDLGTSNTDGTNTDSNAGLRFSCSAKGDDGVMRTTPAVTGHFIADDGKGNKNYSGTLDDAFSALADVGTAGCGIEQHLGAVERALENPVNAGFVRDDAYLAVVVIGDEDDCSLAHGGLFSSSTDGATVNFACTRDGVTCDDTPNDMTTPGPRTTCHPNDHAKWVQPTTRYSEFLRAQKADPRDIVVAGIVGDPTPFAIEQADQVSVLSPSCTYAGATGPQTAFPAVRTADFLAQFDLSTRSTICGADLQQGMVQIGALLKKEFGDPCFASQPEDLDPSTPTLDADCSVSEVKRVAGGTDVELDLIPGCTTTGGATPCWRIEADPVNCSYTKIDPHLKLVIDRGGAAVDPSIHVKASCVTVDAPSGSQT